MIYLAIELKMPSTVLLVQRQKHRDASSDYNYPKPHPHLHILSCYNNLSEAIKHAECALKNLKFTIDDPWTSGDDRALYFEVNIKLLEGL
jgi:hypothetical protein